MTTRTVAVLTVSDRAAEELYEDASGPLVASIVAEQTGWTVGEVRVVPDESDQIEQALLDWVASGTVNLILTTGGTGFAPRDVTPEATRNVIERETPGLAEAMRAASLRVTSHAMLSRAVAGIRERTLIVNLPGSPKAVKENLDIILPVLPHALDLLAESEDSEAGHRMETSL